MICINVHAANIDDTILNRAIFSVASQNDVQSAIWRAACLLDQGGRITSWVDRKDFQRYASLADVPRPVQHEPVLVPLEALEVALEALEQKEYPMCSYPYHEGQWKNMPPPSKVSHYSSTTNLRVCDYCEEKLTSGWGWVPIQTSEALLALRKAVEEGRRMRGQNDPNKA